MHRVILSHRESVLCHFGDPNGPWPPAGSWHRSGAEPAPPTSVPHLRAAAVRLFSFLICLVFWLLCNCTYWLLSLGNFTINLFKSKSMDGSRSLRERVTWWGLNHGHVMLNIPCVALDVLEQHLWRTAASEHPLIKVSETPCKSYWDIIMPQ